MTADDDAITGAKSLLRKAVRLRRDVRPEDRRAVADGERLAVLQQALRQTAPRRVASYLSTGSEPETLAVTGWLAALGIPQLFPVLSTDDGDRREEIAWGRYAGPDQLRTGWQSIIEPTGPVLAADAVRAADVVLCPGLAGALDGARLGRGGGWYDRALVTVQAPVWLLLNDDEVLDALPQHGWDLPVTALVTPTRFLTCG